MNAVEEEFVAEICGIIKVRSFYEQAIGLMGEGFFGRNINSVI